MRFYFEIYWARHVFEFLSNLSTCSIFIRCTIHFWCLEITFVSKSQIQVIFPNKNVRKFIVLSLLWYKSFFNRNFDLKLNFHSTLATENLVKSDLLFWTPSGAMRLINQSFQRFVTLKFSTELWAVQTHSAPVFALLISVSRKSASKRIGKLNVLTRLKLFFILSRRDADGGKFLKWKASLETRVN